MNFAGGSRITQDEVDGRPPATTLQNNAHNSSIGFSTSGSIPLIRPTHSAHSNSHQQQKVKTPRNVRQPTTRSGKGGSRPYARNSDESDPFGIDIAPLNTFENQLYLWVSIIFLNRSDPIWQRSECHL